MSKLPLFALPLFALLLAGCPKPEVITAPWGDGFDRPEVGANYYNTGGQYRVVNGMLNIQGARNHPLWLKRQLPRNAMIELTVLSRSPEGDIKIEAWGDGQSYATTDSYTATSYVFIFGGWGNSTSALCRLDEHGADRKTRSDKKVEMGKSYKWKILRKGNKVEWFIDGQPFLAFDDPQPLEGEKHAYLGFNNWNADLYFDDLKITPL
jgi:hypothetical protein